MAINWGDKPRQHSEAAGIRVWRVPAGLERHGVVLLGEPLRCWTHYEDRTVPCECPDCPACGAVMLTYWPAALVMAKQLIVLELRGDAAEVLRDRPARGLFAWLTRAGTQRFSPIRVEVVEAKRVDLSKPNQLPDAFDVKTILLRLWRSGQAKPQQQPQPEAPTIRLNQRKQA